MKKTLNRRTFLRGATTFGTVAVGLPLLNAMVDGNGTALASGEAMPCRVGIWFWGNGVRTEHFFPEGTVGQKGGLEGGSAAGTPGTLKPWDPAVKQHTKPLADAGLSDMVSLVSGTTVAAFPEQAHHDGKNAVLTGSYEWFQGDGDQGYAGPITPSFDQVAANHFEGQTPFKSLVLGVQEGAANNEPGNSGHYTSSIGRNSYLTPEFSPLAAYMRLFMSTPDGNGPDSEAVAKMIMARRSALDAVLGDLQSLDARLGAHDKVCLEQHLTAVRQLEMRLADGGIAACELPPNPPQDWPTIDGVQRLRDRSRSMSEVLALALSCDMTRAFSYQFTVFQTGHDFQQEPDLMQAITDAYPGGAPLQESFHEAAHFAEYQEAVRIVTNFTFEEMAYTLRLLADIPEGDGTVLSNCAIVGTTEHTEPMSHLTEDMPIVIAGTAGGRLKGGVWYHGTGDEKISKAGLTVLRASGIPVDRFGTRFDNSDEKGGKGTIFSDPSTTETFTQLEN